MSKYTYLIDAGHGGWFDGKYWTKPTDGKFFVHPKFTAYEGVTNRKIARLLITHLTESGINFRQIHHDYQDAASLSVLTDKANAYQKELKNCMYLSIHSNAGKGKGIEVITSIGVTESDKLAEIFYEELVRKVPKEWGGRPDMTDGDHDKEMRLWVLNYTDRPGHPTSMPAVLVELLFFDELKQAEYLNTQIGQEDLARALFNAIKRIEEI